MLATNKLRFLVLMSLAIVATGLAGEPKTSRNTQNPGQDEPLKLRSELVAIHASVIDRQGHPIKTLSSADFSVFEDGVKQRVEHFEPTEGPFTILLLLDISGSTRGDMDLIKKAASEFLAQLRPDDKVGIVVFSKEVELIAEIGDARSRAAAAIRWVRSAPGDSRNQFTLSTGTSFYDALYLASTEPSFKKTESRKAIICMSDGVDSTSQMSYQEVAKLAEQSGASIYFLELNTEEATLGGLLRDRGDAGYVSFSRSQVKRYFDEEDPDSIDRFRDLTVLPAEVKKKINAGLYNIARREMRELSQRAGGRVYPVRALADLDSAYKQVVDDLRAQYLLGYYPANTTTDGRWRKIRVTVRNPDVAVKARSGYWAPTK